MNQEKKAFDQYRELVGSDKWDKDWDDVIIAFAQDLANVDFQVVHMWRKGLVKVATEGRNVIDMLFTFAEELESGNKISEIKFNGKHTYIQFRMPNMKGTGGRQKKKMAARAASREAWLKPLSTDNVDDFAASVDYDENQALYDMGLDIVQDI